MAHRSEALHLFVGAASAAFGEFARDPRARRSIRRVFSALEAPGTPGSRTGSRLPVCSNLEAALDIGTSHQSLVRLVRRFRTIEPMLEWRRRPVHDDSASDNFVDGHANAMIIGPRGLEDRNDAWLGTSLLAPDVRYPDHDHAPEEVYLVLSEGEFRQGEGPWFAPGIGGSFYNEPNVRHAMRSGERPLLAFWALWAGAPS